MKIIVTGSSSGIGKAVAEKLLNEGHYVVGLDVKQPSIRHANYKHHICDITKDLPEVYGVEVLVNNAGVQGSADDIDINLKGTIRVTEKYAIQPQIKSVVFMASASAQTGSEFPEYAASKGGMVTYMKNVALRIAKYGATSNSVSAGGVVTDLNSHIINDSNLWKRVLDETMLNKWATAEEIADLTYYLACVNKSMTGQDILIDNGEALKSNFIW